MAVEINSGETFSGIRHAARDGIVQKATPVFAGVDLASQYVFLLGREPDRSGAS